MPKQPFLTKPWNYSLGVFLQKWVKSQITLTVQKYTSICHAQLYTVKNESHNLHGFTETFSQSKPHPHTFAINPQ